MTMSAICAASKKLIQQDDSVFQSVFTECELGLIIIDKEACLVHWNPWLSKHSQLNEATQIGKKLVEIFPDIKGSRIERGVNSALNDGMSSVISYSLNRKFFPLRNSLGQRLYQQIMIKPIRLEEQDHYCLIQITDVSAAAKRETQLIEQAKTTKAITEKLAQEKERAQVTLDSIADAVITTDEQGKILSMNPVAELLTGHAEELVRNQSVDQILNLIYETTGEPVPCPVERCLKTQDIVVNETDHMLINVVGNQYSITDSVAPIINEDRQLLGTVLVFRDVTKARALSAKLNWQALHDPLTRLGNRRSFENNLKNLLIKAKNENTVHHLLYLDLDQFKVVNDTCGHDAGDELLKQISTVLQGKLRQSDVISRLGGDEFGVLLDSCSAENALLIANSLRQAVEDFRFGWYTQSFKVGVSIGIAEITGTALKAGEILSAADAACYVAKQTGRNRVHFHTQDGSESMEYQQDMKWISRLQAALDKNRFELHLQRIQRIGDKTESMHFEVLLRMISETDELIMPGAFLPAAERFNLIKSIDRWVIEHIFKLMEQLKHHCDEQPLMLSINLSGASMADDELLGRICFLLDRSHLSAESFCFEVTETSAISNLVQATKFLTELRNKGCKVALDDFGSGLSSFAYLKTLPIDYLKIDGYFVKDIAVDNIDKAFVESINQIGQVMGLETIAEFVEDEQIYQILNTIGVNYAQGYGIHKPISATDLFSLKI